MAAHRRALLGFGVVFAALFLIVAIADGIGHPSVPSGDVALIENAPPGAGDVTEADFKHALEQAAAQGGQKKVPKPGSKQYEELKETALNNLLEPIWLEGFAEEEGITFTGKEVIAEREKLKKENFKTEAEFKAFLKQSRYTMADIDQRVKLQKLSTALQGQLEEEAPTPSKGEVEDYYEAAKATQFTQKPSREIRIVVNKNRKKAEEAYEALSKDNTAKNWEKVAKKYSEGSTKEEGGLEKGVTEGSKEEPLDAAIFSAPEGQVEGPVKTEGAYTVFEVEQATPESVQELKAVESQIQGTLAEQAKQEYLTSVVADFSQKWLSRTFCAADYVSERCANFKASGHPSTAPEGCYEANPKGGLPEACPAPVFQLIPALPGTVTPLEPTGKPLAQRPHPAGEKIEGEEEAAAGLPPGAAPPTEAPPTEEAPPEEAPPEESGE